MLGERTMVPDLRAAQRAERARLGVVVSKRIMKKAVARNYCKRLARDVFRHEYARLPGLDFVVRPRAQLDAAVRRSPGLNSGFVATSGNAVPQQSACESIGLAALVAGFAGASRSFCGGLFGVLKSTRRAAVVRQ